jgi:Icc-related predicted phosphoesterase
LAQSGIKEIRPRTGRKNQSWPRRENLCKIEVVTADWFGSSDLLPAANTDVPQGLQGSRKLYRCFFVSDLHGQLTRYQKLFATIAKERPQAVFLGGDLLPHGLDQSWSSSHPSGDFIGEILQPGFTQLQQDLGSAYPRVFLIPGNDDPRSQEPALDKPDNDDLWDYVHARKTDLGTFTVYGYAFVPPTPFLLKDWERYDVSRYVDPGCLSPEEGQRTMPVPAHEIRHATISEDLARLVGPDDLSRAICLFHSPPYQTLLDRAALDGKVVDHVPLDVHVGSIAIQRFLKDHEPLISLHGHVHESTRLTGHWWERIGRTHAFNAAHDGPELSLIRLDLDDLGQATRELL